MIISMEKGATVQQVTKTYPMFTTLVINKWTLLMRGRWAQGHEIVRV